MKYACLLSFPEQKEIKKKQANQQYNASNGQDGKTMWMDDKTETNEYGVPVSSKMIK